VYSSKSGDSTSGCKLSAVKDLCLACIEDTLCWKYGTTPQIGTVFFTDQMRDEWESFYQHFYTEEEVLEIESWETEEELFLCFDRSMQRIMPWLIQRGMRRTCPHVAGACRDVRCCRGTAAVRLIPPRELATGAEAPATKEKEEREEGEEREEKGERKASVLSPSRGTLAEEKEEEEEKQEEEKEEKEVMKQHSSVGLVVGERARQERLRKLMRKKGKKGKQSKWASTWAAM
jgi:hypothetical protein